MVIDDVIEQFVGDPEGPAQAAGPWGQAGLVSVPGPAPGAISWPEKADPAEEARLAGEIVAGLMHPLRSAGPGQRRTYVVVPNPVPYARAQAAFLASLASEPVAPAGVRVLDLPEGGRAYAVDDQALLRRLIPEAFRLGPPELTFIAANLPSAPDAAGEAALIAPILRDQSDLAPGDIAGMHFDSGDLVERF